jgi:thiosulfate dehydrogenase (quinone) large subunit
MPVIDRPQSAAVNGHTEMSSSRIVSARPEATAPRRPLLAVIGLVGLRLALGFEFLWAFLDKTFGLGYATASKDAWINGGSPTKGFLAGANVGPFQGFFRSMSGIAAIDWLFMIGLLGIGLALILGVAIRPAAFSGALLLLMMWAAVWTPAKIAGGQPSGSTNPIVDDHIIGIFGLIVLAGLATWGVSYLGRKWALLRVIQTHPWLR